MDQPAFTEVPDEIEDANDAELLALEQAVFDQNTATFDVPAFTNDGEPVWDQL